MTKAKSNVMTDFGAPIIVLVLICVIMSGLLAFTNGITAPIIAEAERKANEEARLEVLSAADTFDKVEADGLPDAVREVYKAANGAGYTFSLTTTGYGGKNTLKMTVGIDGEGKLTGVKVLSHKETAGLGSKIGGAISGSSMMMLNGIRNMFSRMGGAFGQVANTIGVSVKVLTLATALVGGGECVLGIVIGCLWGYVRWLDRPITELYNIINNVPMIIYLTLIALIFRGLSFPVMCITLIAFGWLVMARNVRNLVFMYRDREYNLASRCVGTPTGKVVLRNLLPYLVSVIMLRMALSIPGAIGSEVFVTYIGLGLPLSIPSLGNLINEGRALMMSESLRYQLLFPTLIVSVVTISFYIIGNAFSDAADPKNHV